MIVLVLVLPLTCWGLAARTARTGWSVAIVLAFCAVAEIVLAKGWLLAGERFTLVAGFALVAAVVLATGIAAERRQPGGLRRAGARIVAGVALSVACIAVSLSGIAVFVLAVLLYGSPASVPSVAGVLPPPAGLAVTGNRNQGCSAGSQTYCTRQIMIQGPAGLPGPQAAQRILSQLRRGYGWHLNSGGPRYWDGCRAEGWLLDRHQVCVSITASLQAATITIQTSDSW